MFFSFSLKCEYKPLCIHKIFLGFTLKMSLDFATNVYLVRSLTVKPIGIKLNKYVYFETFSLTTIR